MEHEINAERSQGGTPDAMVWRRPAHDIQALFRTGGDVLRALGQHGPSGVPHDAIERLERAVTALAAADDWTRRQRRFLKSLRTERARLALTKLVRLGCVPHDLVRCARTFTNQEERDAVAGKRRETEAYLPALRCLAKSFEHLAVDCDAYNKLREWYGGSTFRLDRNIAAFLRDEASAMGEFLREADPRRQHAMFTMAHHHLMDMMRDIKLITGAFQDDLVAEFLNGLPGTRVTADQLKKNRSRFASRGAAWRPPRYLSRPVSRIQLDAAPT